MESKTSTRIIASFSIAFLVVVLFFVVVSVSSSPHYQAALAGETVQGIVVPAALETESSRRTEPEASLLVPQPSGNDAIAAYEHVAQIPNEWVGLLDLAKTHLDETISTNGSGSLQMAFRLFALSIVAELNEKGRYFVNPPGKTLPLFGPDVPEGQIRIGFKDRVYYFGNEEYPEYERLRALIVAKQDVSVKDSLSSHGKDWVEAIPPDLLFAVENEYENVRQRLSDAGN